MTITATATFYFYSTTQAADLVITTSTGRVLVADTFRTRMDAVDAEKQVRKANPDIVFTRLTKKVD